MWSSIKIRAINVDVDEDGAFFGLRKDVFDNYFVTIDQI